MEKLEKSKIEKMTKSWQRCGKGIVLDLFAFWLPKLPLPPTKKQAVEIFCERGWGYVEDEVDAAKEKYAAYRKDEDGGALEGKMSEFTTASKKRRRMGPDPARRDKIRTAKILWISPPKKKKKKNAMLSRGVKSLHSATNSRPCRSNWTRWSRPRTAAKCTYVRS
jgi:hypothetical protein